MTCLTNCLSKLTKLLYAAPIVTFEMLISLFHIVSISQVVQLLETPFVNLVNYSSLVTTNAARHRFVAGKSKTLLEFGLRRAQVIAVAFSRFFPIMELSSLYFLLIDVIVRDPMEE